MKKIFLTGDTSQDWLLFSESYQPPKGNTGMPKNWENNREAQMYQLPGGVLLLNSFLKKLVPETKIILDSYLESGKTISGDVIQTIAEISNISKKPDLIHVKKFLGYHVIPAETNQRITQPGNFPDDVDLIIIDDAGNDIRHFNKQWIKKLDKIKTNFQIIYKTNWPLADNELLNELTRKYSSRIIAIVNADDFREHGLTISRQLSWDKTVDDFLNEFPSSPHFKTLRKCHSLIVRFGLEAVVCVNKKNVKGKNPGSDYRLFYFPLRYEGQIKEELKADMQGMTASFVAAFTKHFLNPYPINDKEEKSASNKFIQSIEDVIASSILPGMYAAINCQQYGYRKSTKNRIDYPVDDIFKESRQDEKIMVVDVSDFLKQPTASAPRSLLDLAALNSKVLIRSVAFDYTINGKSGFLDAVPAGKFNFLTTYDREEVEDNRSFKKIVSEYLKRKNENKPLSYAVFGPPGSGKSFTIKQIINSIGGNIELLERNISQFESYNDLVKTFQASRDITLKGNPPLIFFDEFDADLDGKKLGWLKYFLAPMQDGVFKEGEAIHPLGQGIFVFAGGTSDSLEQFIKPMKEKDENNKESDGAKKFKDAKGPDFISRLKGFINIKGINRRDDKDELFLLRRAMVLRTHLLKIPGIKNQEDKIYIDNDLLGALLEIPEFEHGARSLEAIISMSDLQEARSFKKANLPSGDLLNLHVNNNEFENLMKENHFPVEAIEVIAKQIHQSWLDIERKKGSVKPTMKDWNDLDELSKDSNRLQAMDMMRKLDTFHYKIVSSEKAKGIQQFTESEIEKMAEMEHARWMNEKISKGLTYGKPRNEELKIHDCLLPWEDLDEKTKQLDRNAVKIIPGLMKSVGFAVVKENLKK
jgi:hypothetical protein